MIVFTFLFYIKSLEPSVFFILTEPPLWATFQGFRVTGGQWLPPWAEQLC